MKLGEKLEEGAGSEANAWGEGQIIKLFKPGIDRRAVSHEVHVTRVVFEAGAPAPEVLDVLEVDGRQGIVLSLPRPTQREYPTRMLPASLAYAATTAAGQRTTSRTA